MKILEETSRIRYKRYFMYLQLINILDTYSQHEF